MKRVLTIKSIAELSKPGMYGDLHMPTLYLNVARGGTRSWIQRMVIEGVQREMGLGGYPVIGISKARERAFKNRQAVALGENPFSTRKDRSVSAVTFAEAMEEYFIQHRPKWKPGRNVETWKQSLEKYALPTLAKKTLGFPPA